MVKNTIKRHKGKRTVSYNKKGRVMSKITKRVEENKPKHHDKDIDNSKILPKNIPEKKMARAAEKTDSKDNIRSIKTKNIPADKSIKIESDKSLEEIKSLKDLENKIMEKFEENKIEVATDDPASEEKIIVHNDVKEIEVAEYSKPVILSNDATDKSRDDKNKIEAILFAVGKYLDEETISQLCEVDKRRARKALEELRKEYDSHSGALMIVQEGSSWKINVREKFLSLVRKIVSDTELSKSVMETLSVIAWKSPIYQNEVVRIRGNKCYDHIEELVNAGFISKDKKGRSYILKTTDKFYNYFDIDQKSLKGVMNEAKIPSKQMTLDAQDENKPEEQGYSREKLLHALETIETKSITHTEEEKLSQKQFLDDIHQKIEQAARNTDEVVSEMPRPMYEENSAPQPVIEAVPPKLDSDSVIEKDEEDIVINTDSESGEHHFQKAMQQPQKIKQLTRKQLEKKFKDELQRVKEKTEQKK